MDSLSEYGEKNRRILTYFLKKEGVYNEFVANTKYQHTILNKHSVFFGRQYYNGMFNQAVWEDDGLMNLFANFFFFPSAKYPEAIKLSDGTTKYLDMFTRNEFWLLKRNKWKHFILRREYEEITTLI